MSFGDSNNPYGKPPEQPPQQPQGQPGGQPGQGPGYGYPQQGQPGYGYPQQAPQGVPPQGQDPYGQPPQGSPQDPYGQPQQGSPQGPYGYPQQGQQPPYGAYPQQPGTLQANNGYINIPGLGTVEVATMGRRLCARLIDGVAIGVIVGIIMAVGLAGAVGVTKDCDPASADYSNCVNEASSSIIAVMFTWIAVIAAFSLLYEWLMVSLVGATFGKMAVGLRVVKESTGGNPGLGSGFIRYIIPIVGAFLCYIGAILVYISPFFDNSGKLQGWHDRAAGTLVVKK